MEKIISNDLKYMKQLINKKVEIKTTDGKSISGVVYVIDPVTKCITLYDNINENTYLILKHGIKSMEVIDNIDNSEEISMESRPNEVLTEEDHIKRTNLKNWLNQHCINMEDDGTTLKLGDDLVIEPPYDKDSCFSGNIIILERIRNIIDKMPTNE